LYWIFGAKKNWWFRIRGKEKFLIINLITNNFMNQKGSVSIILVVVIVILLGVVGYFAFVKKSSPIAQQTPTPTPSVEQDETVGWKTYENTKFNYSFKYPANLWGPQNDCFDSDIPIEECNLIKLNSELANKPENLRLNPVFDDSIEVRIVDNPNNLSLKDAVNKLLSGLTTIYSLNLSNKDSKQIYVATFTGALGINLSGPGGYAFNKAKAIFTSIDGNKIFLVSYPIELCFNYNPDRKPDQPLRFNAPCHSDDSIVLYERIIQTFKFLK